MREMDRVTHELKRAARALEVLGVGYLLLSGRDKVQAKPVNLNVGGLPDNVNEDVFKTGAPSNEMPKPSPEQAPALPSPDNPYSTHTGPSHVLIHVTESDGSKTNFRVEAAGTELTVIGESTDANGILWYLVYVPGQSSKTGLIRFDMVADLVPVPKPDAPTGPAFAPTAVAEAPTAGAENATKTVDTTAGANQNETATAAPVMTPEEQKATLDAMDKSLGADFKYVIESNMPAYEGIKVYDSYLVFLDGKVDVSEIVVNLSNGKSFKILASLRGYYKDSQGKLQSVQVPVWVEADGKQSRPDLLLPKATLETMTQGLQGAMPAGSVFDAMVTTEPDKTATKLAKEQRWFAEYAQAYNNDHKGQLDAFISNGDPSIGILIPLQFAAGSSYIVDLAK